MIKKIVKDSKNVKIKCESYLYEENYFQTNNRTKIIKKAKAIIDNSSKCEVEDLYLDVFSKDIYGEIILIFDGLVFVDDTEIHTIFLELGSKMFRISNIFATYNYEIDEAMYEEFIFYINSKLNTFSLSKSDVKIFKREYDRIMNLPHNIKIFREKKLKRILK